MAFDTETTGAVNDPDATKKQSRVVQISCRLIDIQEIPEFPFKFETLNSFTFLVQPGEPIVEGAFKAHGISQEKAETYGLTHEDMCFTFATMLPLADAFLGHNLTFDVRLMRHAFHLEGWEGEPFGGKPIFDTMRRSTNIVKAMPKAGQRHKNHWKWPTLGDAYTFYRLWALEKHLGADYNMARELAKIETYLAENAHDAEADTDMAIEVFFSYMRYTGKTLKEHGFESA